MLAVNMSFTKRKGIVYDPLLCPLRCVNDTVMNSKGVRCGKQRTSMMKNHDIYELLSKALTGKMSDDEQRLFDSWLNESDANRLRYERLKNGDNLMDTYLIYKGMDKRRVWSVINARTHAGRRPHTTLFRRMSYYVAAAAAAVLIIVLWNDNPSAIAPKMSPQVAEAITRAEQSNATGATLSIAGTTPHEVSTTLSIDSAMNESSLPDDAEATIVTHHDKEFWLTLPDGTRVHLNYGTSITYPVSFQGDVRRVQLDGEAYFIIAHDSSHPFIVTTRQGDIKEYGTEFNVNTRGTHTAVTLVNGSISVTNASGHEQMIRPGEMAEMGMSSIKMSKVDVTPLIAWNTGQFNFTDCNLEQLMQVIGRWYACRVTFTDKRLRHLKVTGTLSRYENEQSTIEAIEAVAGVDITVKNRTITIK